MDRLQNTDLSATPPSATSGTTGYPRVASPGNYDASAMHPWYIHMLVEELRAVIVAGSGTPAYSTLDQVQTAIAAQITASNPNASESARGHVELATTAEAVAGTDTERAVTPAGLLAALANNQDYQSFTSSGTWTKPTGLTGNELVLVDLWGAGGGGGAHGQGGGGGGGAHRFATFRASQLGATETVTIGIGGAVNTAGGNSSFGSLLYAYGGGGGINSADSKGGGGGGTLSVGVGAGTGTGGNGYGSAGGAAGSFGLTNAGYGAFDAGGGGGAGTSGVGDATVVGGSSVHGGGGGGGGADSGMNGGVSMYGGGGGAGSGSGGGTATGGASLHGGAGGNTNTAGTAPGGGGGGGTTGGAGAAGECRVLVIR